MEVENFFFFFHKLNYFIFFFIKKIKKSLIMNLLMYLRFMEWKIQI